MTSICVKFSTFQIPQLISRSSHDPPIQQFQGIKILPRPSPLTQFSENGQTDRLASVFKNNFDRNVIERLPCGSAGKESACKAGDLGFSPEFNPWVGKIPWRREWLATPVSLPGEFHGLYSPQDHKELDTAEQLSLSLGIDRVTVLLFPAAHSADCSSIAPLHVCMPPPVIKGLCLWHFHHSVCPESGTSLANLVWLE